jgi:hypothetical protein
MSRHQKKELSKQIVNASKRVQIQDLADGLDGQTNNKSGTPSDVANIYRNIKHDQTFNDLSGQAANSRQGNLGDTVKVAHQAINSESFVTGPDGPLAVNSTGLPQGAGGANRKFVQGHETMDITQDASNKCMGKLPSRKSVIGSTEPSHVNIYINNALIIAKAMKLPDNRKRRIQMADIQHAGVMLGFMDNDKQHKLRLMKSMLPVVNNHVAAKNSHYFVNDPALAYDNEAVNTPGVQPSQHQSQVGKTDIQLAEDASTSNSVIRTRRLDPHKSRMGDFAANDDELLFSDNAGRCKGGARIGSGFLRNSDATESFAQNNFA